MDNDTYTRNVMTVVALVILLQNAAFTVFIWRRLRNGPKLVFWGVLLSPCCCTALMAVGWLVQAYGRSSVSEVASWVLIGAGLLAIPSGMILHLVWWLKRRAQRPSM